MLANDALPNVNRLSDSDPATRGRPSHVNGSRVTEISEDEALSASMRRSRTDILLGSALCASD